MNRQPVNGQRLTVYCLESDRYDGALLHEWLMGRALEAGIARGQVLRAMVSFGRRRRMHYQKLLALADDRALRVEFIDVPEVVERFLADNADALDGYTFVAENVRWHPAVGSGD